MHSTAGRTHQARTVTDNDTIGFLGGTITPDQRLGHQTEVDTLSYDILQLFHVAACLNFSFILNAPILFIKFT